MSIKEFENEIIRDIKMSPETKVLINELKNKIIDLSQCIECADSHWDHLAFIDKYFESVSLSNEH